MHIIMHCTIKRNSLHSRTIKIMDMLPPIQIALTDDHALFRKSMKNLVEVLGNYKIVMEAKTGEDLLEQLSKATTLPEICFLDISMPGMGGVETLKLLQKNYPSIYVIVLTLYSELALINQVMYLGADGFLCKNCDYQDLRSTLEQVIYKMKHKIKEQREEPETYYPNLYEIEIIKNLCKDLSSQEIADKLGISKSALDSHVHQLYFKLKMGNRASIVTFAHNIGIMPS